MNQRKIKDTLEEGCGGPGGGEYLENGPNDIISRYV